MADAIELVSAQPQDATMVADRNTSSNEDIETLAAKQHGHEIEQHAVDAALQPVDDSAPPKRSKIRTIAILCALCLSLLVAALDVTIIATAIPTITADLHSAAGYTWIGGAYLLGTAGTGPLWAKLSDIWGRKKILLLALILFAISSIICATSDSIGMLIAGRAIQGSAGGGLIQLVDICISDLFSIRERSLYFGLLNCIWALAGGIGPTVGGALAEMVSWRFIFWINLPLCGTAFVLLLLFLNVHNPGTSMVDGFKAIDWAGGLSILGFVLMLLLGLQFGGETFPWTSPKVICLIVVGASLSLAFIYCEKRLAEFPLIPPRLFQARSSVATLIVAFMHGFTFLAGEYYLPLYFQSVKGVGPLHSGVLILPITLTESLLGIVSGVVIHRTGRYKELILLGMLLLTIGVGLYIAVDAKSSIGEIIGFELIAGLGTGMVFESPIIAIQAFVSQDDCAVATSTLGLVRNIATSMSIVLGGVVFQNGMQKRAPELAATGLPKSILDKLTGSEAAANVKVVGTIKDEAKRLVVKQAFSSSLRNMWIMFTATGFLGFVAAAFIATKNLSKEHTETVTGLKRMKEVATAAA